MPVISEDVCPVPEDPSLDFTDSLPLGTNLTPLEFGPPSIARPMSPRLMPPNSKLVLLLDSSLV
ncbi:hypothetical protein D3C71_1696650 [compost metagenome]